MPFTRVLDGGSNHRRGLRTLGNINQMPHASEVNPSCGLSIHVPLLGVWGGIVRRIYKPFAKNIGYKTLSVDGYATIYAFLYFEVERRALINCWLIVACGAIVFRREPQLVEGVMPVDLGSMAMIPDEAIKRLRALERLVSKLQYGEPYHPCSVSLVYWCIQNAKGY